MSHSTSFVSVPASAFSGENENGGLSSQSNLSGTARHFNVKMFAPVSLPDGVTVISLQCGGRAFFKRQIAFTLRRNEPQQQNVDIAILKTSLDGTGFEFVETSNIQSAEVDNSKFNYFLVAEIEDPNVVPPTRAFCPNNAAGVPECSVGFCRIGYQSTD